MTLAEIHQRLDRIEGAVDGELDEAKLEHERRLHRLRTIKTRVASMRVALAAGRAVVAPLAPTNVAEKQGTVTEINRFKGSGPGGSAA